MQAMYRQVAGLDIHRLGSGGDGTHGARGWKCPSADTGIRGVQARPPGAGSMAAGAQGGAGGDGEHGY